MLKTRIALKIGAFSFILMLLTAATVGFVFFKGTNSLIISNELERIEQELSLSGLQINTLIENLRNDISLLSKAPAIQGIIRARQEGGMDSFDGSTEDQWKKRLAIIFTDFLKAKPDYTQVRYIGKANNGIEIVRVNRLKDLSVIRVSETGLQTKGDRPYFKQTLKMQKGEIYLSEINLNREKGKVTAPFTPMLRAAIPVYSNQGEVFGILIINMDFGWALNSIHHSRKIEHKHYITNDKGDFLAHPDLSKTFGMDHGKRHTIQGVYPELTKLFDPASSIGVMAIFSKQVEQTFFVSLKKIYFDPLNPERFLTIGQGANYSDIISESKSILRQSILLTLVVIFLGFILVLFFSRQLTLPLRQITLATQQIAEGGAEPPLPLKATDEIGILARSFKTMSEKIQERSQALQEAHDNLETRVQERTVELSSAHKQLKEYSNELERSNQDLKNFTLIASHDLQEPLRKIISFGERLQDSSGELNSQAKGFLQRIQDSANRMQGFIEDLLEYSQVTRKKLGFEPVDLNDIVQEVLCDLDTQIVETEGVVNVNPFPVIEADRMHMRQLFQNLIENSLKYHRKGVPPTVNLSSSIKESGDYEIIIEDNGIGFENKYSDRIFKMFERLHGRKEFKGTGIGLAICEKIVLRHHGTISVESEVGKGSTFMITMPAKQPESNINM